VNVVPSHHTHHTPHCLVRPDRTPLFHSPTFGVDQVYVDRAEVTRVVEVTPKHVGPHAIKIKGLTGRSCLAGHAFRVPWVDGMCVTNLHQLVRRMDADGVSVSP
jgi:hypothetical protein